MVQAHFFLTILTFFCFSAITLLWISIILFLIIQTQELKVLFWNGVFWAFLKKSGRKKCD